MTLPITIFSIKRCDDGIITSKKGSVQPNKSPYSTLCDILTNTYPDEAADHGADADQEEMIHTFSKFSSHVYGKKNKAGYATYGYSAFLVYRGYEDNPVNTDNAWQEAEIFNFHYKYRDSFDTRLKADDTVGWQTVTEQMALSPSDMAAVKEAGKIRTNVL
ncbi:ADP-ribose pyrophosphatase, mitochondrial [Plakobranchus ocellatus]|uniref:ADP-ribose pyrophosphatase, mitochondrial n=1 Tax=Plakobranchus ocellatus TaxID=259542 RepID=A0AAV3YBY4_9GAST|nr:ADP-ribose pyrophosphatase, mitochondrial [Plakobranchus ocellatus]